MKLLTKLTPVAATLLLSLGTASAVQAEEKSALTVSGFIDMSYVYSDSDAAPSSTSSSDIDQIELNLGYDFGNKLTATVDVEYEDQPDDMEDNQELDVEQAFINYALSDNLSLKAGRFLSYSGWETEEPTGLFQYSGTGYAGYFYGGYQQGVSGLYTGDGYAVAVSVVNDLGGEGTDSEHPGVETMLALMPSDEVTIKAFYSQDGDTELFNTWASYSKDALTLAAEYNTAEDSVYAGSDASGYLLMANYAFETFALTVRYHDYEIENAAGVTTEEGNGFTISPSFAVNDNLLIVTEYRMEEKNGVDIDTLAIEALITF